MNLFPSKIRNLLLPAEIKKPHKEEEEKFKSESEYDESEIETTKKITPKPIEASLSKVEPLEQSIKNTVGEILFGESIQQEQNKSSVPANQILALNNQSEVDLPIYNIKDNNDGSSSKERSSLALWSTDDDNLRKSKKFQVKNILPSFYDMNILQARTDMPEFLEGKFHSSLKS